MKYYLDITLIPGDGLSLYPIWEKLYQQLHLALVEHAVEIEEPIGNTAKNRLKKKSKVGFSFPKYNSNNHFLGNKIRLIALTETDLVALNLDDHFVRLEDYIHKTRIKAVPVDQITGYAFFKRYTVKGNAERLARRRTKRLQSKGVDTDYEQALDYFQNNQDRKPSDKTETRVPFIYLQSETTKQRFPLFIEMVESEQVSEKAEFSCYGLSGQNSVPLF